MREGATPPKSLNFYKMACDFTIGKIEDCKSAVGGIDAIYFVNFGDLGTVTVGTDDQISDMTGTFSAYKYELKGAGNNLEQTATSSRDNGTTFFSQVLSGTLKGISAAMNKEFKIMAWSRPHIVVVDRNGHAMLMGLERGAEMTGGTVTTGSAMGDLSGYTIQFTAEEKLPANLLSGSTTADPFAGMTSATVSIVTG